MAVNWTGSSRMFLKRNRDEHATRPRQDNVSLIDIALRAVDPGHAEVPSAAADRRAATAFFERQAQTRALKRQDKKRVARLGLADSRMASRSYSMPGRLDSTSLQAQVRRPRLGTEYHQHEAKLGDEVVYDEPSHAPASITRPTAALSPASKRRRLDALAARLKQDRRLGTIQRTESAPASFGARRVGQIGKAAPTITPTLELPFASTVSFPASNSSHPDSELTIRPWTGMRRFLSPSTTESTTPVRPSTASTTPLHRSGEHDAQSELAPARQDIQVPPLTASSAIRRIWSQGRLQARSSNDPVPTQSSLARSLSEGRSPAFTEEDEPRPYEDEGDDSSSKDGSLRVESIPSSAVIRPSLRRVDSGSSHAASSARPEDAIQAATEARPTSCSTASPALATATSQTESPGEKATMQAFKPLPEPQALAGPVLRESNGTQPGEYARRKVLEHAEKRRSLTADHTNVSRSTAAASSSGLTSSVSFRSRSAHSVRRGGNASR